jgi:hypothetical protein
VERIVIAMQRHVKHMSAETNKQVTLKDSNPPPPLIQIKSVTSRLAGIRCSLVVEALGYKPECRRFETSWGEILNLTNPFGRTRPWGSLSL